LLSQSGIAAALSISELRPGIVGCLLYRASLGFGAVSSGFLL
jgi:hypothetical protein